MDVSLVRRIAVPAVSSLLLLALTFAVLPTAADSRPSGKGKIGVGDARPVLTQNLVAPVISGTDPASPSKDAAPRVFGEAKALPGMRVQIYVDDPSCSGRPDARGSRRTFTGPGIRVRVPIDRTVTLTASARWRKQTSACSAPISYTHDPRTYTPGGRTVGDPLFPQIGNTGYDATHYDLRFVYDPATNLFGAGTRTTIDAVATQNLSQFTLDFQPLDVSAVTVDGVPAAFAFESTSPVLGGGPPVTQPTKLVVTPKQGLKDGASFRVVVEYSGEPVTFTDADETIEGWIRACYTVEAVRICDGSFTVNEPNGAQGYFPSNNIPTDKASFDTHTTVPNGQTALGTGELVSTVDNGDGTSTWNWSEDDPAPPYLTTGTVGDFDFSVASMTETLTGRTLPVYRAFDVSATPAQEAVINNGLDEIPAQQNFLSDRLGPYPFDSTGAVADRTTGVGYTLENLGKIHYSRLNISAGTQIHELAHQWMGNSVSPASWNTLWFAEGWATFMPWYQEGVAVAEEEFDRIYETTTAEEWELVPDVLDGDPANLFAGLATYERPAATLEGYRQIVGDARLFEFARGTMAKYGYGNIDYERFVELAKEYSGLSGADLALLDSYFDQWLRQPAKPTILPEDF